MDLRPLRPGLSAGVLLLLLAACGGGGGGGGGAAGGSGGGRLPPSLFETSEYGANFGLAAIGASSAYAEGATGKGIKIAVIDSGLDVDHPEFRGAIDPASVDIIDPASGVDDPDGHGTAVAGLIGARKNDALTHGVAFDATILAIQAGISCDSGCLFDQTDTAVATEYAVAQGARVINYSLGGSNVLSGVFEAALARAADAGAILVFAAGNGGGTRPTLPARFVTGEFADGRAIAVGAVDAGKEIASFSNRAGEAQGAYLVAPGVGVAAPARGGGSGAFSGTSFSAPHVAGAAAVLLEAAPFLRPEQVVELLFASAEDLGAAGTDPVYGHGLVDLGAALGPQGPLSIPLGTSAGGASAPLEASGLTLGLAFGAGPQWGQAIFLDGYGRPYRLDLDRHVRTNGRGPDLLHWLAPDSRIRSVTAPLGEHTGIRLDLAETTRPDLKGPRAEPDDGRIEGFALTTGVPGRGDLTLMHEWNIGGQFGLAASDPRIGDTRLAPAAAYSPYLAFADGGDGLTLSGDPSPGLTLRAGFARATPADTGLDRGQRRVAVAEVAQTWESGAALALQVGSLAEDASLLDAAGGGAMALHGALTNFVGLAASLPILRAADDGSGISLFGQAHYGVTRADGADGSLIRDVSTLHSTAFGAGLAYDGLLRADDRLALSLAQPIRVEGGTTTVDLPVARALDGTIERRPERVDLAPAAREVDVELAYDMPLEAGQRLSLTWLTRIHPGHDADRGPAHALGFRWRARY